MSLSLNVDARFKIQLCLHEKLTIIGDNSGVGKTFIGKYLETCNATHDIVYSEQGFSYVYVNKYSDFTHALSGYGDKVVIFIDEYECWTPDEQSDTTNKIIQAVGMQNKIYYFIIAHRGTNPVVQYVNEWCRLVYDANSKKYYLSYYPAV